MTPDTQTADRLAWVDRVIATPPMIHPGADGGAWSTSANCYRFMADHVDVGSHTLETGAGLSTVLFAAWGCDHLAVVPDEAEMTAILEYCTSNGIDTTTLHFDIRPSETALPATDSSRLDLVFVDGCHGFPLPIIDWFYGAGRLRRGGVVVFDDVQLPQVGTFLDLFVERDDRWERIKATPKWAAYRRLSEGSLAEGHLEQPFFPEAPTDRWRRLKDAVPLSVRRALKRR